MKLCPIAIVAGCKKCPAFELCPLKGVIGDYEGNPSGENKDAEPQADPGPDSPEQGVDT